MHQVRARSAPDSQSAVHFVRGLCMALCGESRKRNELPCATVCEFVPALRQDRGPAIRRVCCFVIVRPVIQRSGAVIPHLFCHAQNGGTRQGRPAPLWSSSVKNRGVAVHQVQWLNHLQSRRTLAGNLRHHGICSTLSALHNKRINYARVACPTAQVRCTCAAGYARRWVAERRGKR